MNKDFLFPIFLYTVKLSHFLVIQCFMICKRVSVSKYFAANVTSFHNWTFMLISHMSSNRRAWDELFETYLLGVYWLNGKHLLLWLIKLFMFLSVLRHLSHWTGVVPSDLWRSLMCLLKLSALLKPFPQIGHASENVHEFTVLKTYWWLKKLLSPLEALIISLWALDLWDLRVDKDLEEYSHRSHFWSCPSFSWISITWSLQHLL